VTAKQPRIAIADVGQNRFEELDYTTVAAASGADFGWDAFEGFAPYTEENSGTPAVLIWTLRLRRSLRGPAAQPRPHLGRASSDRKLGLAVGSPTSFGEDDRHRIYVCSEEGPAYRLISR
jgi:hypothetical protein